VLITFNPRPRPHCGTSPRLTRKVEMHCIPLVGVQCGQDCQSASNCVNEPSQTHGALQHCSELASVHSFSSFATTDRKTRQQSPTQPHLEKPHLRQQLLFPSWNLFPSSVPRSYILGKKCSSQVHLTRIGALTGIAAVILTPRLKAEFGARKRK
jgi:hypothetical protein